MVRTTAVMLLALSCGKSDKPAKTEPKHIDTKVGRIEVADPIPEGAEFMCSADLEVVPRAELHVVPTFQESLKRYVGSYRCNKHWKEAIAETRARFAKNATENEGAGILQVFLERGVTREQARVFTAGKPIDEAVTAMLDALEAGKLVLDP